MNVFEYRGLRYGTHPEVYAPAEDSFLLVEAVLDESLAGRSVVELGCGTGLASVAAASRGARVVAVDTNPDAVRLARANAALNGVAVRTVRGDLARSLRGAFDVLLFNPPYLPTDADDLAGARRTRLFDAWEAGAQGMDVVDRFLDDLAGGRASFGALLLVTSSLQDAESLGRRLRALGYEGTVLREAKVPWERLRVAKWVRGP